MNPGAPTPPPGPPEPPGPPVPRDSGGNAPFGLQVGFGFFLPVVACGVTVLGLILAGGLKGGWSGIGVFVSGILGMLTLAAGIRLAARRGWRGVLLGFVLFGALIVLLIGACFVMLAKLGGK